MVDALHLAAGHLVLLLLAIACIHAAALTREIVVCLHLQLTHPPVVDFGSCNQPQ
jgi:hypothetical protein